MKQAFGFSILLNVILLSGFGFLLLRPGPAAPSRTTSTVLAPPPSFLWSRVESSDWSTYISNLRRFECPERDIRAIISSEIDAQYGLKRVEIEKTSEDQTSGLRRLKQEEDDLLASLFDEKKVEAEAVSGAAVAPVDIPFLRPVPPGAPLVVMPSNENVSIPASFAVAEPDPDLNAAQLEKIQQISDQFLKELGPQNPNDTTYSDRWQKAQQAADEKLRMVLGQEAYQKYTLKASHIDTRP